MIRKRQETDGEAIIGVWYAASLLATPFLSEAFLAEERDKILKIWLPKAETLVFEVGGKVVGFLSLIGNEVGAIFVHPDSQGRGIGRALMDHAASLHEELVLEVFEDNAIGRRFYDGYGREVFRIDPLWPLPERHRQKTPPTPYRATNWLMPKAITPTIAPSR